MAWTVPTGCYYAIYESSSFYYYGAGTSVPTNRSPNNSSIKPYSWALIDFNNKYIYTAIKDATINIKSNNTFTITVSGGAGGYVISNIIASTVALNDHNLTLTGTQFSFGNGSNMLNKTALLPSSFHWMMKYSFAGRNITSATIPTGIDYFSYTFENCTNLQSVSGTIGTLACAPNMFYGCTSLTTVPTFQGNVGSASDFSGVISTALLGSFEKCFYNCSSLATPPRIPTGVTSMASCFYGCTSLTTAPTLPSSINTLNACFQGCSSLSGAITVNCSPSNYTNVFASTVNEIVLFGNGSSNVAIASTYNNVYIWSLASSITATRSESISTTVDISVRVSRYNTGTLTSLSLYEDSSQTPTAVTWSDPTLTISSNPTTFTTTLSNIAEGDTPLISIVATDMYGSATKVSVRVPVAFYTMDVQAGGKEITFGVIADDDLTNYPDGLFKCAMSFINMKLVGEIKMWAGNTVPTGWLVCDGSAVSRTTYPLLFDAIGTLWGAGDGSTTFNLPDLKGRVPVGQDTSDTAFDVVGETGGAKTHLHTTGDFKLLETHIPAHTHGSKTVSYGFTIRRQGSGSTSAWGVSNTSVAASSQKNITSNAVGTGSQYGDTLTLSASHTHTSFGGSTAHNHGNTGNGSSLQPYAVVKYIICAV